MSGKDRSNPAFANRVNSGMTLRDYMAGQALAGILANSGTTLLGDETYAGVSYWMADAMLKARDE